MLGLCNKNLDNRGEAESNFLKSLQLDCSSVPLFENYLSTRDSNLDDLPRIIDNFHFEPQTLWLKHYFKLYNTKQSLDTFLKMKYTSKSNHNNLTHHFNANSSPNPNPLFEIPQNPQIENSTDFLTDNFLQNENENDKEGNDDSLRIEEENVDPGIKIENPRPQTSLAPSPESVIKRLLENGNPQLLYMKAKSLFENYELNEAYKVCKRVLTLNSFHVDTLLIYSELLVERKVIFYPDIYLLSRVSNITLTESLIIIISKISTSLHIIQSPSQPPAHLHPLSPVRQRTVHDLNLSLRTVPLQLHHLPRLRHVLLPHEKV